MIHCVKQSCAIDITVEDGKDGNKKKKKTLVLKKGAGRILHGGTYIGDCVGDKTCPLNTLQFVDTILEEVSVMGMFQSTIDGSLFASYFNRRNLCGPLNFIRIQHN